MTITDSHSNHLLAQLNVTFVDALSTTFIISSHTITESSTILSKYLLYSQIHAPGFQLLSF